MSASFDFQAPDFFATGAVGPPGQRVFYLQAREAGTAATLKLEKEHVGALAEHLAGVLTKLQAASQAPPGSAALLEPVTPAWVVGSIGVAWDEEADRFVLALEELVEQEDEEERERVEQEAGEPATARFRLTRAQAGAFVARARELLQAGRKPCLICGRPMDPRGHICPRSNGHAPG